MIEDIEAKILKNLLQYIYVGECALLKKVDKDENEMANLLIAADKYDVALLKEECELHFSRTLAVENAKNYLVFADLYNANNLKISVLDFMEKNTKAIFSREDWRELMEIDPELFFQATQRMAGLWIWISLVNILVTIL